MSIPYVDHPPHKLILNDDGTFVVKAGDCLSKYNWAINGNWGNSDTWSLFARPGSPDPIAITPDKNQNLIKTGETLIYLPKYKGKPGSKPTPAPNPGGGGTAPPGYDFELPMYKKVSKLVEKGKFLFQFTVTAQGMVATKGVTITAGNKEDIAKLVSDDIAVSAAKEVDTTVTVDELIAVAKAVLKQDIHGFNAAMGDLVSYTIMRSTRFEQGFARLEGGIESSLTPVRLAGSFGTKGAVPFNGETLEYAGKFTVTMKVGLSREGWAKVIELIENVIEKLGTGGRAAVRAFVWVFGSAAAAEIGLWCGFVALAIGATLGFMQLFEWVMDYGRANPYAPIYAQMYANSVFYSDSMNIPQAVSGEQGQQMVVAAVGDVIRDMQARDIAVPQTSVPSYAAIAADPRGFWKPNRTALRIYAHDLTGSANGDERTAWNRIYNLTLKKAEEM